MPKNLVHRADSGAVAILTLNDPSRLNVLSEEMMAALHAAFDSLAADHSIRVVVLRGEGKGFCAGHDLKQMTAARQAEDGGKSYFKALFETCSRLMLRIQSLPQPVIAEVHGVAAAAGCQLVATCDMAVADENARFGVNGVNIGLFCSTPMVALSRAIGRKKAFEMLTTGAFLNPDQALENGLINKVTTSDQRAAVAMELAETVASKLSSAVKIGKQAFYKQAELPIAEAYAYTGEVMVENMLYRDTEEGIAAFVEKRTPNWEQD